MKANNAEMRLHGLPAREHGEHEKGMSTVSKCYDEIKIFSVEKMYILPDAGALLAFCDIAIADVIVIRGVRIMKGKKGLFIGLPREQGKDSKWYDQIIFKNVKLYEELQDVCINHYKKQGGKP